MYATSVFLWLALPVVLHSKSSLNPGHSQTVRNTLRNSSSLSYLNEGFVHLGCFGLMWETRPMTNMGTYFQWYMYSVIVWRQYMLHQAPQTIKRPIFIMAFYNLSASISSKTATKITIIWIAKKTHVGRVIGFSPNQDTLSLATTHVHDAPSIQQWHFTKIHLHLVALCGAHKHRQQLWHPEGWMFCAPLYCWNLLLSFMGMVTQCSSAAAVFIGLSGREALRLRPREERAEGKTTQD